VGQKVNPVGFRILNKKSWESVWFDKKSYAIQGVELTDTDKIDIDKVIKREEISLNLNGIKYIFRGKDGIETTQNPASSITTSVILNKLQTTSTHC
jgi:hypothetical protein